MINSGPGDFPKVIGELDFLSLFLSTLPAIYKKEIFLSFLKKQSLKNDWIAGKPELAMLIRSGVLILIIQNRFLIPASGTNNSDRDMKISFVQLLHDPLLQNLRAHEEPLNQTP
jgi:hypothetical protein